MIVIKLKLIIDGMFEVCVCVIVSMVNVGVSGVLMFLKVEDLWIVLVIVVVEVVKIVIKEGVVMEEFEDIIQVVQDVMWYLVYKLICVI